MPTNDENQNSFSLTREALIDLYERRIIVLVENGRDEGGGFSQVIFDKDQFKKVSAAIMGCFPKEVDPDDPETDWYDMTIEIRRVIPDSHFEGMTSHG